MKIFVKNLKGNHFQIEVNSEDTVSDVKKNIESVHGANVFPASQQMLIYQGKILTDGTTLEQNKVAENSFIVIMLSKSKSLSGESSMATVATPTPKSKSLSGRRSGAEEAMPTSKDCQSKSLPVESSVAAVSTPASKSKSSSGKRSVAAAAAAAMPTSKDCQSKSLPAESSVAAASVPTSESKGLSAEVAAAAMPTSKGKSLSPESSVAAAAAPTCKVPATREFPSVEASTTPPTNVTNASLPASLPTSVPAPISSSVSGSDIDGQKVPDLVARNDLEITVQHILDMGGGIWKRDTVVRALHAACNNPERAVEYLYSGIPEQAEIPSLSQSVGAGLPRSTSSMSQQPAIPSNGPNAGLLNIFHRGLLNPGSDATPSGALDFLRHSEQFQALRAMVQANPQVLQPMLQELGKQNPNLIRLIQEHQTDFRRLLNEPVEGNIPEQLAAAMPLAIKVTTEEHATIERLEAMGFDRSTVLEVYFACNKNEELTANYLLDHMHEFE